MALNISYAISAIDRFSRTMDKLDNKLDNFENRRDIKIGVIMTGIPTLAPMIATATGALGGLSSSFAAAGSGAIAFSSLAVTALNDVYAASEDIAKINEKLSITDDVEKRNQLLQKRADIMSQLSGNQQRALKSLQSFSSFWSGFAKKLEKPVVDIFIQSLRTLETVIKRLEPAFKGSVSAVSNLLSRLNEAMKSPDIQAFFDMINNRAGPALENWGRIFGNVIRGIMNLMVAFNPTAKKMEGGLLEMTQSFVKWSQNLSKSKGFKKFINYITTNGPKMLDLIGNLVMFIINLGIALAPLGEKILDIVNGFLKFANKMLTTYPIIGKIIAIIWGFSSAMKLIMPAVRIASAAMKIFRAAWIKTAAKALWSAARVAASWLIAMGPVGWVIAVIVGLVALIIYYWDEIKAWTIKTFKKIWGFIKSVWAWIDALLTKYLGDIWKNIKKYFVEMYETIKKYFTMAWQNLKRTWEFIKDSFNNAVKFIKALLSGDFKAMKNIIKDQMDNINKYISDIWDNITDFLKGIDLVDIGMDIMRGLLRGIGNMAGDIWAKVRDIASGVKDAITGFFTISSPSKLMTYMGEMIGLGLARGIEGMTRTVGKATDKLAQSAQLPAIDGVKLGGVSSPAVRNPKPIRRGGYAREELRKDSGSENSKVYALLSNIERAIRESSGDTVLTIDGREFARATIEDIYDEVKWKEKIDMLTQGERING